MHMATATTNAVPLSGEPVIDGLVQGSRWQFGTGPRVVTYSLSLNDGPNGAWSQELRDMYRAAFAEWAKVIDVSFVEVGSGTVFNQSTADIAVTPVGQDLWWARAPIEVSLPPHGTVT